VIVWSSTSWTEVISNLLAGCLLFLPGRRRRLEATRRPAGRADPSLELVYLSLPQGEFPDLVAEGPRDRHPRLAQAVS
jgi:hypothetical protein